MVHQGQCLCGAVRFAGLGETRGITPCHCGQCRRWAGGGPFMAVHFSEGVALEAGDRLRWFASSDHGQRGFCGACGTSLFWRRPGEPRIWAVNASALPEDHGLGIAAHVWVEDAAPWYAFADDAPRLTAADVLVETARETPK